MNPYDLCYSFDTGGASKFALGGYDAVKSEGRRRSPATRVKSEDLVLKKNDRLKLIATSQDLIRNFTIAAWAVRKHLDYVSSFSFQSRSGIDEVDDAVESFMGNWSRRMNCDVRRRHPFRRMIRMAETRRVVDGDFFFLKLAGRTNRGYLQAIEADRIQNPDRANQPENDADGDWVQGVRLSAEGTPRSFAIHRRDDNANYVFDRIVPATSVLVHGFYDRFDQVRGISPIAAAINQFQDVYEGFDYSLAKIKVSQLFGLVFYREAIEPFDTTTATLDKDGDGIADSGYEVDFRKGPQVLDLNPGDKAEFLESNSPPSEVTAFLQMMIHASLKALDIPYSFFDESFTNFYGSRGGLIQYLKSCKTKIADLQDLLDDITRWRLGMALADGELKLPRLFDFEQLNWQWIPDGVPWWDPTKEVAGHAAAIAAGLASYQDVCQQSGTDFYTNIDQIAAAQEYAEQRGVTLTLSGVSTARAAAEVDQRQEVEKVEEQGVTNER